MAETKECPCHTCTARSRHGIPRIKTTPSEELPLLVRPLAKSIFANFDTLQSTIRAFEDLIVAKWAGMDQAARRALLKTAWGEEIPENHRPDFAYIRDGQIWAKGKEQLSTHAFDTPYINYEDLCKEGALLVWMKSRSDHYPGEFALNDAINANLKPGQHFPKDTQNSVMLFYGGNTADSYGIVRLKKDVKSVVHTGMMPAVGLYLLKVQERIMAFLVNCCRHLLPEQDLDDLPASTCTPPPPQRIHNATWPTTAILALEAAYSAPTEVKLSELQVLIQGKVAEYEDQVCAMKHRPELYFPALTAEEEITWKTDDSTMGLVNKVLQLKPQLPRSSETQDPDEIMLLRARPVIEALTKTGKPDWQVALLKRMNMAIVTKNCIANPLMSLLYWQKAETRMARLKSLYDKHKDDSRSARLPRKVENAFLDLEALFKLILKNAMDRIRQGLMVQIGRLAPQPGMKPEMQRLHYTFDALLNHTTVMHSLQSTMDEIQHMIDNDKKAASLFAPWLVKEFSNIALCARICDQFDTIQPWATSWKLNSIAGDVQARLKDSVIITADNMNTAVFAHSIECTIFPNERLMEYPIDYKPSKPNVYQMRFVELLHDSFFDSLYTVLFEELDDERFGLRLAELIERWGAPSRTPKWTVKERKPKSVARSNITSIDDQSAPTSSFPIVQQPLTAHSVAIRPKQKQKTRPEEPVDTQNAPQAVEQQDLDDESTKIPLDRRSWQCFDTLFNMTSRAQPGELSWDDFCYSMEYIGFETVMLGYPQYTFRPKADSQWQRPFSRHAPHPGRKWQKQQFREVAGHLKRALDLGTHSFEKE